MSLDDSQIRLIEQMSPTLHFPSGDLALHALRSCPSLKKEADGVLFSALINAGWAPTQPIAPPPPTSAVDSLTGATYLRDQLDKRRHIPYEGVLLNTFLFNIRTAIHESWPSANLPSRKPYLDFVFGQTDLQPEAVDLDAFDSEIRMWVSARLSDKHRELIELSNVHHTRDVVKILRDTHEDVLAPNLTGTIRALVNSSQGIRSGQEWYCHLMKLNNRLGQYKLAEGLLAALVETQCRPDTRAYLHGTPTDILSKLRSMTTAPAPIHLGHRRPTGKTSSPAEPVMRSPRTSARLTQPPARANVAKEPALSEDTPSTE